MNQDFFVVYPHFHKRRTGITSALEQIISHDRIENKVYVLGSGINREYINTNIILLFEKIFFYYKNKKKVIWFANRNNEAAIGLVLRFFFRNIKIIYTRHSDTVPSRLTRMIFLRSDVAITLTRKMQRKFFMPSVYIPHGVDVNYFSNAKATVALKDFGLCTKYIGVVGRVRPEKGQLDVLRASIEKLKSDRKLGLIFLGHVKSGQLKYRYKMEALAVENDVFEQVFFIEQISDIRDYYRKFNVVVVPSYSEGFSMVPLEAMSSGCPVIATKGVGIHSDIIKEGITGWLYSPGDTKKLSEILDKIIDDQDICEMISRKAREEIVENWTVGHEVRELQKIYTEVVNL